MTHPWLRVPGLQPAAEDELQRVEPYWQAQLAVGVALVLYVTLPGKLTIGPTWLMALLEGMLLVGLAISTPYRHHTQAPARRRVALALVAIVSVANLVALGLVVESLLEGDKAGGRELLRSGMEIWVTNAIIFGLWFWELDRGGPEERTRAEQRPPDFLFPQMTSPGLAAPDWRPRFIDYLYVSFTNATAFSPTDTMPLTPMAKWLMLAESLGSLLTVALVAARAVNVLS